MHKHFSDLEISALGRMLGSDFNVRRNKAGNITVEYLPEFNNCSKCGRKFWTLYYTQNDAYLWRRHTGYGYCFPLHSVGRKRISPIQKVVYNSKTYYWYSREWNMKNCEFEKFFEAITYFIKYLKKYRNIDVKAKHNSCVDNAVKALSETLFTKEYIEKCTDSDYLDWIDWFDNNYPIHTISERSEFGIKIDREYKKCVNKFFGKIIDYNELNDIVGNLRVIRDKINNIAENNNYNDYNTSLKNISKNITESGKELQNIVNEIYSKIN